jgi:hypothetical protein
VSSEVGSVGFAGSHPRAQVGGLLSVIVALHAHMVQREDREPEDETSLSTTTHMRTGARSSHSFPARGESPSGRKGGREVKAGHLALDVPRAHPGVLRVPLVDDESCAYSRC